MSELLGFLKGFLLTFTILAAVSAVIGVWYASEIDMGGRNITWTSGPYSGSKPYVYPSDNDLVYKSWFDSYYTTFHFTCAFINVSSTACNSAYCYANKATAQKKCEDNSYDFVSGWEYIPNCIGWAYTWSGSSWVNMTATDSYAPAPKGGGSYFVCGGSGKDTSYLKSVYCCTA